MRALVSAISAIAFLLHMWLGCCAHHLHAAEAASCAHAAEAHETHACHEHGPAAPQDESPVAPSEQPERCTGGQCMVAGVGKVQVTQELAAAPLWVAECLSSPQLGAPAADVIDTGGPPEPPVRLHLLHQVLLS
jgi:hypothetical protein